MCPLLEQPPTARYTLCLGMKRQAGNCVTSSIELVAPIAEGAMGKVWIAYHTGLKTKVAVKFVSQRLGPDAAEARARFQREASTASQIKSPHVVQVFDSGLTRDGDPYIVMELLEGESLGDRLRMVNRVGLTEAANIIVQVGRGLIKAHALGIVHRDIKPDNIFLCRTDLGVLCKVLDFGIAKQTHLPKIDGLTSDGKIVGTPQYMSPEQVLEEGRVDYRLDLWALAVVMYVALTGVLPFDGNTLGRLCINLATKKPPLASSLRPDLGPAVDAWFEKALNRDPEQRYGSAKEMAETFSALVKDPTFQPLSVASGVFQHDTERQFGSARSVLSGKSKARRPIMIATVAAGLALILAGAMGLRGSESETTTPVPGAAAKQNDVLSGDHEQEKVDAPAPINQQSVGSSEARSSKPTKSSPAPSASMTPDESKKQPSATSSRRAKRARRTPRSTADRAKAEPVKAEPQAPQPPSSEPPKPKLPAASKKPATAPTSGRRGTAELGF